MQSRIHEANEKGVRGIGERVGSSEKKEFTRELRGSKKEGILSRGFVLGKTQSASMPAKLTVSRQE